MFHPLVNVIRYTLYLLLYIVILVCISSCSPEKRIARIAKKYNLVKTDTIFKKDTVIVEGAMRDTTIHYYQRDTVVVKENNMTLRYYYNIHDSTVYLRGECAADTIYRDIPVAVNSISVTDSKGIRGKVFDYLLNNILTLLLLLIVIYIARRNRS